MAALPRIALRMYVKATSYYSLRVRLRGGELLGMVNNPTSNHD